MGDTTEMLAALRNAHTIIRCEAISNDADLVLREIERVLFNATGEVLFGVPSGNPTAPGVPSPLPPVEHTDGNGTRPTATGSETPDG